jgi:serine/threonine protein kinase
MGFDQIGKYEVLGLLGRGAMGEVKKARDPVLNRLVAIKTIAKSIVLDEQFKKRFEREARTAALLSHPNIVTVYELGEEEGVVYLVMELLGGTDLRELIARRAPMSLKDKLSIAEQICAGLAFAHDKGIVHRDLKPANVHVSPGGGVKILDFGLARLSTSDLTRTGTIMGTPNYMSPEQVRGARADARSDLFAVGAVLYETLSGQKAFKSESTHATLYDVLERDPIPLRSLLPLLPPAVAAVAERALRKDPADRFASANEMRRALEAARLSSESMDLDLAETLTGTERAIPFTSGGSLAPTAIVDGSTALDLRSPSSSPTLAVPEPTLAPTSAVTLPGRLWRGRRATVGLAAAMMTVFALGYWWMLKTPARPSAAQPSLLELERAWVQSQTAAAQMSLEIRDYGAAVAEAERILARDPQSREAREILEEGRRLQGELGTAAEEVRAAFTRGDQAGARDALKQVLALDARHPVVVEIGPALDRYFRGQADNARRVATRAQRVAQGAGASASSDFRAAATLVAEGEALFGSGKFTQATQKFVEGSDAFARARRQGEAPRAAAPTSAPAPAVAVLAETPPPPTAMPSVPGRRSLPTAPTAASAPPAPDPAIPSALPTTTGPSPEQAVREVIADYGRALETRDLGLFKSVMPGLSREKERQVRESFRDVRSLRVSLAVQAVEVSGGRARARVSRLDVLEGKGMKPIDAIFVLVERDGVWAIESIGP